MRRAILLSLAAAVFIGCQDEQFPTGTDVIPPQAAILDALHDDGNPDFFYLPPLVPNPSGDLFDGSGDPLFEPEGFNDGLTPVVDICELAETVEANIDENTLCLTTRPTGFPIQFTTTSGFGGETVVLGVDHYHVDWHTDLSALSDGAFYRISVSVQGERLGFADVDVVNSGKGLKNVDTDEFVALKDGRTLPIKFRIEEFALCPDTRNCATKAVGTGDVQLVLDGIVVDVPDQGGAFGTLTLKPCTGGDGAVDGLIDLPTFGPCLESETDFVDQTLAFPATISLCDLSAFPEIATLSTPQERQLTLYHFADDPTGAIDALPEANNCPETSPLPEQDASLLSNPLFRFARAIGDRILSFTAPRPLHAAFMRRINRGGGGNTNVFGSKFKLVLPGKILFIDDAVRTNVEVGTSVTAKVRVVDLFGVGVAGATVRYTLGASPEPTEPHPPASLPAITVVETGTGVDPGDADISWTISSKPGLNELTAGGRGIADPDNGPPSHNGPRAEFDPFIPIQAVDPENPAPGEEVLVPVRDAAGLPVTKITFTVDGVPGPPAEILFTVPPINSEAGATIPVVVTLEDQFDNVATNATAANAVSLAIGTDPSGGTATLLGGTAVTPVLGVSTFSLSIDLAGAGYTLVASTAMLTNAATSAAFAIFGNFVYTNDDPSGANTVSAFSVAANGVLTAITGSPFATGGDGRTGPRLFASNRATVCSVGNFLYASNGGSNDVSGFAIDPVTGNLNPVLGSPFSTGGSAGNGISLAETPDGQYLMAGNAGSSNITVFSIAPNGALTPITGSPFAAGSSPDGMRVTPDGLFLAVAFPNLSGGSVGMFEIAASGALTPVTGSPFPDGGTGTAAGVDINAASDLLFAGEANSGNTIVDVFSIAGDGALTPIGGSPFLAVVGDNSNVPLLSPDDQLLFVSNQASSSVTVFGVADGGSLTLVAGSPFSVGGLATNTAGMATNRAGTFLYTANISNLVGVFSIAANGVLTSVTGSPFSTGQGTGLLSLTAFPARIR